MVVHYSRKPGVELELLILHFIMPNSNVSGINESLTKSEAGEVPAEYHLLCAQLHTHLSSCVCEGEGLRAIS